MTKKIKNLNLNFGPQHPAAHGVLRLILEFWLSIFWIAYFLEISKSICKSGVILNVSENNPYDDRITPLSITELIEEIKNDKIKMLLKTFDDADLINVQKDDD